MHLALPSPPVLFAVLFALCSAVAAAKIPGIPRSSDGSEDTDHGAILSGQDVRALSDGHANVFTLGNAAAEVDVSPDAGINIPIDAETIADDTKHPKRKRNVGSGGSGRGPGSGRPGQDGSADPSSVRYAPLLRNFDFSGLVSRERYIDYLVMVEALLQETMAALGMTPGQRLYCSPMVMFFVKLEEAVRFYLPFLSLSFFFLNVDVRYDGVAT